MFFDFSVLKDALEIVHRSAGAAAVLVGSGAAGTGLVGYLINRRNLQNGNFRRRILFVGVSMEGVDAESGEILVDFNPHGDEYELKEVIGIPALERAIASATRHTSNGVLRLKNELFHRRMMNIFERHVRGNDHTANFDKIKRRTTFSDRVAIMPTFFREDDVSMVYVFIVDDTLVEGKLQKQEFRARLKTLFDQHTESVDMVRQMGIEAADVVNQAHGGTALVRYTTAITARKNG